MGTIYHTTNSCQNRKQQDDNSLKFKKLTTKDLENYRIGSYGYIL